MQSTVPPPPLTCRMCVPPANFWRYEVFRAHLRAVHKKKVLIEGEIRQFENFPNASTHLVYGPRSARDNRDGGVSSDRPSTPDVNNSSGIQPNVASVAGSSNSAPALRVTTSAGTSNVSQSGRSTHPPSVPVVSDALIADMRGIVASTVRAELSREIDNRLPFLNDEIRLQVSHAVQAEIPTAICEAVFKMASAYANDSPSRSGRVLLTRPAMFSTARQYISDGNNVFVRFSTENNSDDIQATASDEELMAVSPTILDGNALVNSSVDKVC